MMLFSGNSLQSLLRQPQACLQALQSLLRQPEACLQALQSLLRQPEACLQALQSLLRQPEACLQALQSLLRQPPASLQALQGNARFAHAFRRGRRAAVLAGEGVRAHPALPGPGLADPAYCPAHHYARFAVHLFSFMVFLPPAGSVLWHVCLYLPVVGDSIFAIPTLPWLPVFGIYHIDCASPIAAIIQHV